jgi:hypothetical protein
MPNVFSVVRRYRPDATLAAFYEYAPCLNDYDSDLWQMGVIA